MSHISAEPFTAYGFEFWPMRLKDWMRLDVWMQDDYRAKAIETAQHAGLKGKDLVSYYHAMHRASMLLNCSSPEGLAKLNTIDGSIRVLEVASRGKFSRDELEKVLDDDPELAGFALSQAVEQLVARVYMLTDSLADDEKGPVDIEDVDPTQAQATTAEFSES